MLNFIRFFFYVYWNLPVFYLINMVYYIDWFSYVQPTLHSWVDFYVIVMCNFFMLLDWFCWYFLENFCICIHKVYWSVVSFSCDIWFGFGIRIILVPYVGSLFSYSIFFERGLKTFGSIYQCNCLSWFFFLGIFVNFLIIFYFSIAADTVLYEELCSFKNIKQELLFPMWRYSA